MHPTVAAHPVGLCKSWTSNKLGSVDFTFPDTAMLEGVFVTRSELRKILPWPQKKKKKKENFKVELPRVPSIGCR